ncbi:MAG: hypothetical protein AAF655_21575 [Bacteroidota bacterium]
MEGIPLLTAFDGSIIPLDVISPSGVVEEMLSRVFITNYIVTQPAPEQSKVEYHLSISEEARFNLVGIDGLELIMGGINNPALIVAWIMEENNGNSVQLLGSLGLSITSQLLKPVILSNGAYIPDPDHENVLFPLSAGVEIDQDFTVTFVAGNSFTLRPVMIGNTGVVIEGEIAFDLSEQTALPESTALGLPESWKGVVFRSLSLHLPESINVPIAPNELALTNFHIGNGGVSGYISGNWVNTYNQTTNTFEGNGVGEFLGFAFALSSIELSFHQNTLTGSAIQGKLKVPFFEAALDVLISLTNEGDFTIGIASVNGLIQLEKEDIIRLQVNSLAFSKESSIYALTLTGEMQPLLADLSWPSLQVDGLTVNSRGEVKVDGGWIDLEELKTLDFHKFKIEISQIGFGSDVFQGDTYNWVGFSGGIQLVSGLPLRGGVEGLQVMWNRETNEPRLKVGGVYLEFEIQEILTFKGAATFFDEEDEQTGLRNRGFKGGIQVGLTVLNGAGFDAQFIAGDNGQYKFFYIFLNVELPVGIPILPPTLGLFGLAGLFGYNMTLDYQGLITYEPAGNRPSMTDVDNWISEEDALAFGAGVSVGTLADNAFTVKAKVILAVLVPGPVILIEGFVKVLSSSENYPFRLLAVLDIPSGTFLMNIGINFEYPADSGGDLLQVSGSSELYVAAGSERDWHLYMGQDQPESKRLIANVLGFFTAESYFMVDSEGLALGVFIGVGVNENYGVLKVVLESWMGGTLEVSWAPLQAIGTFGWIGRVELSAFGIGLGLSIEADARVEVPKPLLLEGNVRVELKTPLGNPKANINVRWEKEGVPPFPIPLASIQGVEHRKVSENWDIQKVSRYALDADGLWDGTTTSVGNIAEDTLAVVPPDVFLAVNFDKSVADLSLICSNTVVIPSIESVGGYEFCYELADIDLSYSPSWASNLENLNWQSSGDGMSDFSMIASWQAIPDSAEMANTKLLINASTSLEISRLLEDNSTWIYQLGLQNPGYPCIEMPPLSWESMDFGGLPEGEVVYPILEEDGWQFFADYPMEVFPQKGSDPSLVHALVGLKEIEEFDCLMVAIRNPNSKRNQMTTRKVRIRAANFPQEYIHYRKEREPYLDYYRQTELYINRSNPTTPAHISFPANHFPSSPDKIEIVLMVNGLYNPRVIAYDENAIEVDRVEDFSHCTKNPDVIRLSSTKGRPIRKVEFIGLNFEIKKICWNKYRYTHERKFSVRPPVPMASLKFTFSEGSTGHIYFLDEGGKKLDSIFFQVKSAEQSTIQIEELPAKVDSIRLEGEFALASVSGIPQSLVDARKEVSQRQTHFRTTLEENWGKHSAHILSPNTYYRLKIDTISKRRKKGNDTWSEQTFSEYIYFKTGNPPGVDVSAVDAAEREKYPIGGPLVNLASYVQACIPAGGPPNEVQHLHYRSYDVGIIFNDSYVEQMYQAAGLTLGMRLMDNNRNPVLTEDEEEIFINGWGDNTSLVLTREETAYQTLWDKDNCNGVSVVTPDQSQEFLAQTPHLALAARTQYIAQLLAGTEDVVYEFHFITSRYANFWHHMHSFEHRLWESLALQRDPSHEIDVSSLFGLMGRVEPEKEYQIAEQLLTMFDLVPRTLPAQVEITLLNDSHGAYGFMLESPEPIPHERVPNIGLSSVPYEGDIMSQKAAVKIIDAYISGKAQNQTGDNDDRTQRVELLVLEERDLSGYRVAYQENMDAEDSLLFYQFEEESIYPVGTKIVIFYGRESNATHESIEEVHLFAEMDIQPFSGEKMRVQLLNEEDEILQVHPFFPAKQFMEEYIQVVRNRDHTRFFIMPVSKTKKVRYVNLHNGLYRLSLTYLRDVGEDELVLRRFGQTTSESVKLDFVLDMQNDQKRT